MKRFHLLISLTLCFSAGAKTIIVSDIDDTIRQSNVVDKGDAFLRLFSAPDAFEGLKHHLSTSMRTRNKNPLPAPVTLPPPTSAQVILSSTMPPVG